MSYTRHFYHDGENTAELRPWVYFHRPSAIYETGDIQHADSNAAADIARLEAIIADLKEYRRDLAARYAELETMPYTYKLSLVRHKGWYDKKVTYTVRLMRVLPDGKEIDERREEYPGTERKKAFELFAQLKKERPGIDAIQDTEKKQWEK